MNKIKEFLNSPEINRLKEIFKLFNDKDNLKLPKTPLNKNDYEYYPAINYNLLNSNQKYAVVTYSFSGAFSTRAVATVQNLKFDKVEIFKHTKE